MEIQEKSTVHGFYTLEGYDEQGNRVFFEQENLVVQNFFTSVFTLLTGGAAALNVTHIAVGSGTNAASKSDTALQTETYRKAYSTISATPTKLTVKCSVGPSEMVGTWREIGVFINGTGTAGSGSLLSRANINFAKTSGTQLLITYTLTIQ